MKATQFQTLLYGATGIIYIPEQSTRPTRIAGTPLKILALLRNLNVLLVNPEAVFAPQKLSHLTTILDGIQPVVQSATVEAYKLRGTFASTEELERYTPEEWTAILAQYAIVYGWTPQYITCFSEDPVTVLQRYANDNNFKDAVKLPSSKAKEVTLADDEYMKTYLLSILESPVPLRTQQKQMLRETPANLLEGLQPTFKVTATEAFFVGLQYTQGVTVSFKSPTLLMRFILANFQQSDNDIDYSGQITNSMLKTFKFHLPTRAKKMILQYFDNCKNVSWVAEQLLTNEQWWKRCLHHSHWTSATREAKRYPNLKQLTNKLYDNDRSWTFTSRYSGAMQRGDFATAITTLTERPGLLLRSLINMLKYPIGTPLASRSKTISTSDILLGKTKSAQTDITEFLVWKFEEFLKETKPAIKTAWQFLEEVKSPAHQKSVSTREVQGVTVHYTTPIPPINADLASMAVTAVKSYIKSVKKPANKALGKVFIDPALADLAVQYSGAESTDNQVSGNFLTPGSSTSIPEDTKFVRLGVVWRDVGKGSCDVDLNTSAVRGNTVHQCYYGEPALEIRYKGEAAMLAVSSGDVVHCAKDTYSSEFIDIDYQLAKRIGVSTFLNTLVLYSGRTLADYDVHLFINFISAADRIMPREIINIDLSRQVYATKINDSAKSYIGTYIDVKTGKCQFVSKSLSGTRHDYANIVSEYSQITSILENLPQRLTVDYILRKSLKKSQVVTNRDDADIIITADNSGTLNVLTHGEDLNKIIF